MQKYKQKLNKILNKNTTISQKHNYSNQCIRNLSHLFFRHYKMDRLRKLNTRTTSNKYIHHIYSATERFTLKLKLREQGFIDIKNLHYQQLNNLHTYMIC